MDHSLPLSPAARATALRQIYQDASRSDNLRDPEATVITGLMLMLYDQRGVEPTTIAAAMAEQAARTKLAEQAHRNIAAARANLVREEPAVRYQRTALTLLLLPRSPDTSQPDASERRLWADVGQAEP